MADWHDDPSTIKMPVRQDIIPVRGTPTHIVAERLENTNGFFSSYEAYIWGGPQIKEFFDDAGDGVRLVERGKYVCLEFDNEALYMKFMLAKTFELKYSWSVIVGVFFE